VKDGHKIRMLVRSKQRVPLALGPFGLNPSNVEIMLGDVTDRDSVKKALAGMVAIIHAASVYTMDKRRKNEIVSTNKTGTQIVLSEAWKADLDPIVFVSSVAAVMSSRKGFVLSPSAPPKPVKMGAYTDSKAEQEILARDFQMKGAPVVIIYPGSVMGPYDPHWGDGTSMVEQILKRKVIPVVDSHIPIVDVRDIARIHSAVLESGKGARRYMLGGTSMALTETVKLLARLTGRNIRGLNVPVWLLDPIVNALDLVQNVLPVSLPFTKEAFTILKWDLSFDDSSTIEWLNLPTIDVETTMIDMVRWMHSTGRISGDSVGQLALHDSDS